MQPWPPRVTSPHLPPMIYARLISFHPAEDGEPAEHFDITFPVGMSFARAATDANARILTFLNGTEDFAVPRADDTFSVWVWPEVVKTVVVWEGEVGGAFPFRVFPTAG